MREQKGGRWLVVYYVWKRVEVEGEGGGCEPRMMDENVVMEWEEQEGRKMKRCDQQWWECGYLFFHSQRRPMSRWRNLRESNLKRSDLTRSGLMSSERVEEEGVKNRE